MQPRDALTTPPPPPPSRAAASLPGALALPFADSLKAKEAALSKQFQARPARPQRQRLFPSEMWRAPSRSSVGS
jgi:hypothetical protein